MLRSARVVGGSVVGGLVLAALAAPAPAGAVTLISQPPSSVRCGSSIRLQVWFRSYDGGSSRVRLSVLSAGKKVLRKRTTRAPSAGFRTKLTYKPRCGRTYYARFVTNGSTGTYKIRVRG